VKLENIKLDAIATSNHGLFMNEMLRYYCMIKALITLLKNDLSSQYTINNVSAVIRPVFSLFHQTINDNANMLVNRIDYVNGLINNFCDMIQEGLHPNLLTFLTAQVRRYF
jgi:deoxyadenosine/deoxycytidine kinase